MSGGLEPIGLSAKALGVLKDLPLWLLTAVAAWLLLFPFLPFAGELLSPFALGWVRAAGILFALLAAFRLCSGVIPMVQAWRARHTEGRTVHLTLDDHQSFWHVAKQPDGSMVTQFELRFMAKNLTDAPLHLLKARVVRPKIRGDVIQDMVLVRAIKENIYGSEQAHGHYIPANSLLPVSVGVYIRSTPKQTTGRMRMLIGVTDANGNETRVRLDLNNV